MQQKSDVTHKTPNIYCLALYREKVCQHLAEKINLQPSDECIMLLNIMSHQGHTGSNQKETPFHIHQADHNQKGMIPSVGGEDLDPGSLCFAGRNVNEYSIMGKQAGRLLKMLNMNLSYDQQFCS